MRLISITIVALLALRGAASAAPGCLPVDYQRGLCVSRAAIVSPAAPARAREVLNRLTVPSTRTVSPATVQPHPAGCPSRAFCGCGASVRLFGRPVRELYLAANWLKFPRAAPAPGMAAARPGHVFVLEQHVRDDVWLVYDANSGGRQTRLHERSVRGYAIVNPRA